MSYISCNWKFPSLGVSINATLGGSITATLVEESLE
jgi:hypothetical protein